PFAVVLVHEHGYPAFWRDGPQGRFFVGAGDEISLGIEIHSVGAAGGLLEGGQFAIHAPFHDAIVRLVGEEDVSVRVATWPFSEGEAARELLDGGAWFNDRWHFVCLCVREENRAGERNNQGGKSWGF